MLTTSCLQRKETTINDGSGGTEPDSPQYDSSCPHHPLPNRSTYTPPYIINRIGRCQASLTAGFGHPRLASGQCGLHTNATLEATMTYEVIIEEFVLQCEIKHLEDVKPNRNSWDSDWDFFGYREMEFTVVSGTTYDDGVPMDLGRNGCAAAAERYAEQIEELLWEQVDADRRERAA
ncbi:hypothetical protein D9M71_282240 [compost metagenome]